MIRLILCLFFGMVSYAAGSDASFLPISVKVETDPKNSKMLNIIIENKLNTPVTVNSQSIRDVNLVVDLWTINPDHTPNVKSLLPLKGRVHSDDAPSLLDTAKQIMAKSDALSLPAKETIIFHIDLGNMLANQFTLLKPNGFLVVGLHFSNLIPAAGTPPKPSEDYMGTDFYSESIWYSLRNGVLNSEIGHK